LLRPDSGPTSPSRALVPTV